MVETYRDVVQAAEARGFDALANDSYNDLAALVRPIGLPQTRIDYLRSLADLLALWDKQTIDPSSPSADVDDLVADFAERVRGASFKVAQCALLNARGYHSGIIPVDSGMVTKLAPALGIDLPTGPVAHEKFRHAIEAAVHARPDDFRELAAQHDHAVAIPDGVEPTWWAHLVLIYFKRLYLNGPSHRPADPSPVLHAGGRLPAPEAWVMTTLAVIGNVSCDTTRYPDDRGGVGLGGAALLVSLAAARAGLLGADGVRAGQRTRRPARRRGVRRPGLDGGDPCGRSCDAIRPHLQHGRRPARRHRGLRRRSHADRPRPRPSRPVHRRPAPRVLSTPPRCRSGPRRTGRAGSGLQRRLLPAERRAPDQGSAAMAPGRSTVFVNAAEYEILLTLMNPVRLREVVVTDGARTARVLEFGEVVAKVRPPERSARDVTGAGDTLAGTYRASGPGGATVQHALVHAVAAAAEHVTAPPLPIPAPRRA